MTILLAYHNDPSVKASALATIEKHRRLDKLVQGYGYWKDGKGCAVGCQIHSGNHAEYEPRFGIPQMLARLEDAIFEGLPVDDARMWPGRFMAAPKVGADLSRVGWQFLYCLLTDETVNPGINHPDVRDVVRQCADVLVPLTEGEPVDESAARSAAESAWSAESAAWSAECAAESAAWSAESAARSAESAAEESAESAAESAERAESAARSAARSAAWKLMADNLIELMEAA